MTEFALRPKDWLETPDTIVNELGGIEDGNIIIDAAGCDVMGAQTAQILLAAQLSAQKRGANLNLLNISDRLKRELELLGISSKFAPAEG
ncbi:MAG: STAS domain-containing protein [Litoreibacter sp.]|nr:STAS domain-containing protein [Litoreibacter sp.]MCY4335741.1 STAS domain-containing protein [Litoreibacter sp.]